MLNIGGENIDCVNNFNFLGIVLNHHLNWHSHTNIIANKICKIIGILNKLKHILPRQILSNIYTSLVTPHLNYGILLWGHDATRIDKLQKKAIRTIKKSKYNAHTEPIFKKIQLLKLKAAACQSLWPVTCQVCLQCRRPAKSPGISGSLQRWGVISRSPGIVKKTPGIEGI